MLLGSVSGCCDLRQRRVSRVGSRGLWILWTLRGQGLTCLHLQAQGLTQSRDVADICYRNEQMSCQPEVVRRVTQTFAEFGSPERKNLSALPWVGVFIPIF